MKNKIFSQEIAGHRKRQKKNNEKKKEKRKMRKTQTTTINIFKFSLFYIEKFESAKLRALRAHVPTCLACLRAQVPCVLSCSRANVPLPAYAFICYNFK